MPSMREIAQAAQVSVSTVSRALSSEDRRISEKTRRRIREIARALESREAAGQTEPVQTKGLVGLLWHNSLNNPFYTELIRAISMQLRNNGMWLCTLYCENTRPEERTQMQEQLVQMPIEGMILIRSGPLPEDLLARCRVRGLPIIQLLTKYHDDLDFIGLNDDLSCYRALHYLLGAGHERIVMFQNHGQEMVESAYAEFGRQVPPFFHPHLTVMNNQMEYITNYLRQHRPTAVIPHTQGNIIETLEACRRLNLRIPEDISVVAYDDSKWLQHLDITAVAQPFHDIADTLCHLLLARMKDGLQDPPANVLFEPVLIARNSVRRLEPGPTK